MSIVTESRNEVNFGFLVTSIRDLKGSCQLGTTQTFVAPNGEYLTATLKGPSYLHLTGNLNLAPMDVEASTESGDTIFPIEIWMGSPESGLYEMCYLYEGAKTVDFKLAYWNL